MTAKDPRRAARVAALGIAVLLVGSCGASASGTPDPGWGGTPLASAEDRPSPPSAAVASNPARAIPSPSEEPGLIVDRSFAWGTIAWSPSGATLAAAAMTQQLGQGEIHLFERSGRQAGVIPGIDLAWVDDGHLVVVQRNSDGVSSSARLWSKDARDSQLLAARMSSIVGNGRGTVAIAFDDQDAAQATYRVWVAGVLSKVRTGIPVAWSADGRLLAVAHDPGEASVDGRIAAGPRAAFAAGSSTPTWLEVVELPSQRRVAAFRNVRMDGRIPPLFDATGGSLAGLGDDGRPVVLRLAPRTIEPIELAAAVLGWTSDGRLALEGTAPHVVRLWDPASTALGPALGAGVRFATIDGQIVTVPDRSDDPSPEVKTSGAVTPDGAIRARTGPAIDDGMLRLSPEPATPPVP